MGIGVKKGGAFILLVGSLFAAAGCSGQGESKPLIAVIPESAVLTLGATQKFVASPAGTSITWSVKGATGANSANGTIDATGLYMAPSLGAIDTSEVPEKVTIKATDNTGVSGIATAFLTTFKANTRLTQYTTGAFRANTYSAGQRGIAVYKDISSGNVTVYAVWADDSQGAPDIPQIWFRKSSDGGNTFDDPVVVDNTFSKQISPTIAVDGSGNVFVVWEDYRYGDANIFIKKYDSSGFGVSYRVNPDSGGIVDYDSNPSIAIDSLNTIYVVWEHRSSLLDDYPDIYFASGTNGGGTFSFSAPTTIAYNGRRPAIAIDALNDAYVVWEDLNGYPGFSPTHIEMGKIQGGVVTIGPTQIDTPLTSFDQARYPSVAVGPGGRVYVVWQRAFILNPGFTGEIISTYDLDLARVDSGTLQSNVTLSFPSNPNVGFFGGPAYSTIAADSNNIYLAWDDERNGTKDIYFARSSNGAIFTTNRIVNDNVGSDTWHEKPSIAVSDDGKAYVLWTDYRNASSVTSISPNDVFFAREE